MAILSPAHRTVRPLLAAALVGLWGWSAAATAAERTVYRSIRDRSERPLDELDLPRTEERASHWGWDARTKHFVVFATTSRDDARWAAGQLEASWTEFGKLADHWTDIHHRPDFAAGAVGVLIADRAGGPRAGATAWPQNGSGEPQIYLTGSGGAGSVRESGPELRAKAVRAFLRATGHDRVLPEWVQAGLAAYVAEETPGTGPIAALPAPQPTRAGQPVVETWPPGDRIERPVGQPAARSDRRADRGDDAGLWVRYLLEGYDARFALRFFDAMAAAVDQSPDRWFAPGEGGPATPYSAAGSIRSAAGPLDQLLRAEDVRQGLDAWLADPRVGQPDVADDTTLDATRQEMLLVLKLAKRFSSPVPSGIRPKILVQGEDRTAELLGEPARPSAASVYGLYERLTDPSYPAWASLDTDGSLLLSGDRGRLDEIFRPRDRRYRTLLRDGTLVLEARLDNGEVLQAWLEPDQDAPQRPIARFQRAENDDSL